MSSISPRPSRRSTSALHHREDVLAAQRAHRVRRVEIEAHVHLHAADGREVVALRIEEQRMEHRFRRVHRRRLARTHDAIDVEQRFLAERVLVDGQRVADVGTDVDVVDVEHRQLVEALFDQQRQRLHGDLVAGFGEDLAGRRIDRGPARDIGRRGPRAGLDRLHALLGELARGAHGELLAGLENHLAGVGVDHVGDRLHALHALGVEGHAPVVAVGLVR